MSEGKGDPVFFLAIHKNKTVTYASLKEWTIYEYLGDRASRALRHKRKKVL
jgi:hypothetical protein